MKVAYVNGVVDTITNGYCEAFVVENEQFIYVGNNAEASQLADQSVDLKGKFVTCGFNDSHMHVLGFGHMLEMMDLFTCTDSLENLLAGIKQYIQDKNWPSDVWLRGRGWNNDYFQDTHRFINRYDLDRVSTDIPLVMTRACGHICVVNSKALDLLGIDRYTPQIEGGKFDVDENGEPLGIFREQAIMMIYQPISKVKVSDLKRMIRSASQALNSYGITSVQTDDFTNFNVTYKEVVQAYEELENEGQLSVKVTQQAQLPTLSLLKDYISQGYQQRQTKLYRSGPLKLIGDGSLGARTAALSEPYADDPSTKGIACFTQAELDELISYAHAHQMPCAVHCIGDEIMKMVVKSYQKVLQDDPDNTLRHGIIHCQITDQDLLDAFKKWHLLAYVQPIFLDYDITMVASRVGEEKAQKTYAFKTLFDTTNTSGGSDCPVELPNVMRGIQCAVTRKTLKGEGPFVPTEALSVEEALRAFTLNGAYASHEEATKGSIEVGKMADFVILDHNPTKVTPQEIGQISVLATYLNGRCVYQK